MTDQLPDSTPGLNPNSPREYRQERFTELAALGNGWLDGDGNAVDPHAVDMAQQVVAVLVPVLGAPGIFPTVEGGVLMEWVTEQSVRSVEIEPSPSLAVICFDLADEAVEVNSIEAVLHYFRPRTAPRVPDTKQNGAHAAAPRRR